ncbi:hypothetical protein CLM85_09660 [Streptomyces albidoflavus]|nr:hypothetical protein CLM85_09660 [Streptomyces albidoflavus]
MAGRLIMEGAANRVRQAGCRLRIRRVTERAELREFDEKIAGVRRDKESASDSQDFEKAGDSRTEPPRPTGAMHSVPVNSRRTVTERVRNVMCWARSPDAEWTRQRGLR